MKICKLNCNDMYCMVINALDKISSSTVVERILYYLFDKYLFFFLWFYFTNFINFHSENYFKEWIIALMLIIPISLSCTYIVRKMLYSLKTRMFFFLLIFIFYKYDYFDLIELFSLAMLCMAFLLIIKRNNSLLALPLIFVSASYDLSIVVLLIPVLVLLYFKNKSSITFLGITISLNYIRAVFVVVIIGVIEGITLGVSVFRLLVNDSAEWLLFRIPKLDIAFITLLCMLGYYECRRNNEQNNVILGNAFHLFIIYNLVGVLMNNDFCFAISNILAFYLFLKNFIHIKALILRASKKSILAYLKMVAFIVSLRLILFASFYSGGPRAVKFLNTSYYISYFQYGFIQRGVIGTLLEMIFGTYIPQSVLEPFTHVFMFALRLFLLFTVFLFMRVSQTSINANDNILFFCCLICFLPYYCCYPIDYINLLLGFLCIYFALENRVTIVLIPFICLFAMIIHQVFVSLVFPMVFSVLMYRIFVKCEKHKKRNFLVLILTLVIVGASFIYLTFYNAKSIPFTVDQMKNIIIDRSGGFFDVDTYFLRYVFLDKNNEHFKYYSKEILDVVYMNLLKYLLLLMPIFIIYILAYIYSARCEEVKSKKLSYYLSMVSPIVILPLFLRDTDFGRWVAHLTMIATVMPAVLLFMQSKEKQWDKVNNKMRVLGILAFIFLLIIPEQPNPEFRSFSLLI